MSEEYKQTSAAFALELTIHQLENLDESRSDEEVVRCFTTLYRGILKALRGEE